MAWNTRKNSGKNGIIKMAGFLLDTNSVIYFFNGEKKISAIIEGLKDRFYISFITKIELFCFESTDEAVKKTIHEFLREVEIIYIDDEIINNTIYCRKKMKLKLPDAIIAATAITKGIPLITADKVFQKLKDVEIISPI